MEIREALQNGLEGLKEEAAPEVEKPEFVETEEVTTEGRQRDEKGRFAPKEKPAEEVPEVVEAQPDPVPEKKAPSSWRPEAQQAFVKAARGEPLTPEEARIVAEEAERRESDFHKGIQTYKEAATFGRELHQAFTPHAEFLQEIRATPSQAVGVLMNTARILYQGTPEQKAREVADMCHRHGIDIASLAEIPPVDPTIRALQAEVQRLSQFVSGAQQQPEQPAIDPSLVNEVQQFKATNPHFDAVREDMAFLLESGRASGMQDAYDKAVRMNDRLWQESQAQQRAQAEAKAKQEAAQRAKAAAVSVKGSAPGATVQSAPASTDLRATLAANLASMRDRI